MRSAQLDPAEQQVIDDIRDHGCHIMHVVDLDGDDPEFSYSIGIPVTAGQPEVIVFSLKREVRQWMLNEVLRQCSLGLRLTDGLRISNLIEGFDCIARHVVSAEAIREHFGWALWYHQSQRGRPMKDAYQIVWPGAQQGLFPWDDGCDEYVIAVQPSLYKPSLNS